MPGRLNQNVLIKEMGHYIVLRNIFKELVILLLFITVINCYTLIALLYILFYFLSHKRYHHREVVQLLDFLILLKMTQFIPWMSWTISLHYEMSRSSWFTNVETDPVNHVKALDDQFKSVYLSVGHKMDIVSNGNKGHVKYIFYYADMVQGFYHYISCIYQWQYTLK